MRRLVFLVALLGLVASACASSAETIEAAAAPAGAVEEVAPGSDDVAVPSSDVPMPESVVYETGRQALAASEGKPHVLWFWAPN
ncbi:MAG: hypothetical protein R8J94_03925 [Acidimicrobiia bacterium]|nr:hypothetical protein [Acidimicrobiia bacterium]